MWGFPHVLFIRKDFSLDLLVWEYYYSISVLVKFILDIHLSKYVKPYMPTLIGCLSFFLTVQCVLYDLQFSPCFPFLLLLLAVSIPSSLPIFTLSLFRTHSDTVPHIPTLSRWHTLRHYVRIMVSSQHTHISFHNSSAPCPPMLFPIYLSVVLSLTHSWIVAQITDYSHGCGTNLSLC